MTLLAMVLIQGIEAKFWCSHCNKSFKSRCFQANFQSKAPKSGLNLSILKKHEKLRDSDAIIVARYLFSKTIASNF